MTEPPRRCMMTRVARNLGTPTGAPAPPAVRAAPPGWRDPRIWVGIVIVAVSVVAGARLMGAADDTVQVWAAAADLGAGDQVGPDDLVATRVRFADGDALAGYFSVDDQLPADLELTRAVDAGELVPRAAVGARGESGTVQLPVAVDADQVPGSVDAGSVVDVWLVPGGAGRPALSAVTVVDAPPLDEGFTTSGKRQLVLAVPEADAARFFRLLGSRDDAVLTVVRRG